MRENYKEGELISMTNSMEQPQPTEVQQTVSVIERAKNHKFIIGAAVAGAVLIGGSLLISSCESDDSSSETETSTDQKYDTKSGCANLEQAYAAAEGNFYGPTSFLPKYETTDPQEAVKALFDEDGPLSNKGDLSSLAAFHAAVSGPANDGSTVNPQYNYGVAFQEKFSQYTNNGLEVAKEDCQVAYDTAFESADYVERWAAPGDTITELATVRDESSNRITGMLPDQRVTQENIDGVVFKVPTSNTELDGFTEVMYEEGTGRMFVKGATVGIGIRFDIDGNPVSITENPDVTVPVDTIITPEGVEVPVTWVVTPEGEEIPVTINPETGEPTAVNPETGEPTGEPIPAGSVPKETDQGQSGSGGEPTGSGPSHEGPGTSQPGTVDTVPATTTGPGTTAPGTTTPGTTPTPVTTTSVKPTTTTTTVKPTTTTTTVKPTTTTTTVKPTTTTTTVKPTTTTSTTTTTTTTTQPKGPEVTIPGAPN